MIKQTFNELLTISSGRKLPVVSTVKINLSGFEDIFIIYSESKPNYSSFLKQSPQ